MKKKSTNNNSRRGFLKNSAAAAAGFYIVPRHVLGGKNYKAPSDKLNLACIGAGGKGWSDIRNAWDDGNNNVVAICDVDTKQAKRAREKWPKAKFYKDFRIMLREMKNEIDAVTISAPDHIHGIAAMSAMREGIHVYVQKPLTHNIYEARQLTEGARKFKVVTQMGNQGASQASQYKMVEWYNAGELGTVHTVYVWTNRPVWPQGIPFPTDQQALPDHMTAQDWDLYNGPGEAYDYNNLFHTFNWRGWWNYGTGALGDMGCHLIDTPFRVLGLGYPTEVEASVGAVFKRMWTPEHMPEGCPPSSNVQVGFEASAKNPSPIKMIWNDGGIRPFHPEDIPADHDIGEAGSGNGVMMIGDKGTMTCGTYGRVPKLYKKNGDILEVGEGYDAGLPFQDKPESGHQASWVEACKQGFESDAHQKLTSSFDYSGPLTETVLMGNLAIRSYALAKKKENGGLDYYGRKKLIWDGKKMEVTNFADANQFVSRPYRPGWKLI